MISSEELHEGGVYFAITYADSELSFPIIRSLVFVGMNMEGTEEQDKWYFQDVGSYCNYGSVSFTESTDANEQAEVHRFENDGLSMLFDLEGLIADLRRGSEKSTGDRGQSKNS